MTGSIVLVGNPNVGKSALFGALTGAYVTVSNYPGTTVELIQGTLTVNSRRLEVVDTPGAASLLPTSEDERVTRDLLLEQPPEAVVVVADAKNLERSLGLVLELGELGVPLVLCLNMIDEAEDRGLRLDARALAAQLGVPVVETVAIEHRGLRQLRAALGEARRPRVAVRYGSEVEAAVTRMAALLPEDPVSARGLAVMVACGDETLTPWLRSRLPTGTLAALEDLRQRLRERCASPAYAVARARQRHAARLAAGARRSAGLALPRRLAQRLETLSTHPSWGWPLLLAVLYTSYVFVGVLGAGTLVDLLEDGLFGGWVNPAVTRAASLLPWAPLRDLLVGPYGLVTMALTYSLALVLPIVGTFFVAFGILEDSGYLPRLAVMVNRPFRTMGLSGKAVLPMVLGLGCDTMATLTTRILETPKERLIVILLLALGVPCSAQLAVVLGLLSPLPAAAVALWAAIVLGVIVLVGRMAARLLPGRAGDFILELPPLRLPRAGNVLIKTLARVEWYLKEAVPLFVLGTLLLFVLDRLGALAVVQRLGEPVVTGLLGLPAQASEAFLVGFLRRDFGAAGLYRLAREGRLDHAQVLVSVVTVTLFIPCIASFFMIVKERGWRVGLAVSAFTTSFAIGVGALLARALRLFPGLLG